MVFFHLPADWRDVRGVRNPFSDRRGDGSVARRCLARELAHALVRRLDAVVRDTDKLGACGRCIDDQHPEEISGLCARKDFDGTDVLGPFDIRLLVLVRHVYFELLINVEEMVGDLLKRLAVLLERLKQHRLRLKHLSRHDDVRHPLYYPAPCGGARAIVRRAQEDDAVRRDVDRPEVVLVGISEVVRVQQRSFRDDAAEAVGHPNDGIPLGAFALAVVRERRNEGLGVMVDEVVTRAFNRTLPKPSVDVGVVTVHQHIRVLVLQRRGKEVDGPVHSVRGRPCLRWSPVEAVDEDNVGFRLRVLVDGCKLEPGRVLVDGGLAVSLVDRLLGSPVPGLARKNRRGLAWQLEGFLGS